MWRARPTPSWCRPGLKRGANARPAGEDVPRGRAGAAGRAADRPGGGRRWRPPSALAALPVRRLPRVGVFSTGDELAEPGQALGPAQTFDSNRFTLLALLGGLPCVASDLGILPDDAARTAASLAAAARDHDLLLTSGGVSTGEEDHVRAAIEAGGRLVFWRLAVKPGRPAAMGVLPKVGADFAAGGTPVVGLPGNPVAAVVCFLHLARPLLLRLAGAEAAAAPALRRDGRLRLPQEGGAAGICAGRAGDRRLRDHRAQVPARGGGAAVLPDAIGWLRRTAGGCDAGRTRRPRHGDALCRPAVVDASAAGLLLWMLAALLLRRDLRGLARRMRWRRAVAQIAFQPDAAGPSWKIEFALPDGSPVQVVTSDLRLVARPGPSGPFSLLYDPAAPCRVEVPARPGVAALVGLGLAAFGVAQWLR